MKFYLVLLLMQFKKIKKNVLKSAQFVLNTSPFQDAAIP